MKKLISIFLVLALLICMNTTSFAAEIGVREGSTSKDVKGTYVPGGDTATIYSVDVAWGSMEFTYTDTFIGVWNPDLHEYEGRIEAAWSCDTDANKLTVTNHSNTSVYVSLEYTPGKDFDGISGNFSKEHFSLATAEGVTRENAPTENSLLTLSGALGYGSGEPAVIGFVTVALNSD